MAAVFLASIYVESAEGLPQRLPAEAQAMRSLDVMWDWPCDEIAMKGISGSFCIFGAPWEGAKRKTMIWGDSHAMHFAPIIDAINTDPGRSFLVYAGCSSVLGGKLLITFYGGMEQIERCKELHPAALKILKEDPAIDQVILTSNWLDLPVRIGKGNASAGLEAMRRELIDIVTETSTPGRRFFLIGTVPEIPETVVECAHTKSAGLLRVPCAATVRSSDAMTAMQKSAAIDNMFKQLATVLPNVTTVIPAERLCTTGGCDVYMDGEFLYRDIGHIRRNLRLQTRKDFADRIGLSSALSARPEAMLPFRLSNRTDTAHLDVKAAASGRLFYCRRKDQRPRAYYCSPLETYTTIASG